MNKIKKRIASIACAFTMMLSSVTTCFSAASAETAAFSSETSAKISETALTGSDEVLTEQNIALYPNGEEAKQVITLNGLMPEGATAEAVDVSEFHEGVAAYDITISSGEEEYQPGEANPIRVEISDPVISDSVYIELWHIADDGTRERITEFSITDNIISFEATAFSVYEIVTAPKPLPDGTTTAQTVEELDGKGFFISNKDGSNSYYCTGQITDYNDNGTIIKVIQKTAKNDMDNAAVWYFNKTDDNKYLIYTLIGEEKVYMKMTTDGNKGVMALVPEADATAFDVTLDTNNNIKGFYAAGSNEPLARAEFDLYRGTKQPDGSYLQNYYPISGYEALVSGADGVIPKIDETLPSGRYFLREKRSPNGYERFVDAIEFNISELGEVELVNAPIGVFLSSDTSQDGRVLIRIKAGNTRKDAQTANLIVMKKVEGVLGDKTKGFAFTLTVADAADEYFMWTLNEVTQEGIRSGDTFHLAHGDTAVFILPLECEVTIREEAEDYTASMQLNHADALNTDSITFTFSATTELLVTNTRSGILPTGISGTLCKALLLFIIELHNRVCLRHSY